MVGLLLKNTFGMHSIVLIPINLNYVELKDWYYGFCWDMYVDEPESNHSYWQMRQHKKIDKEGTQFNCTVDALIVLMIVNVLCCISPDSNWCLVEF